MMAVMAPKLALLAGGMAEQRYSAENVLAKTPHSWLVMSSPREPAQPQSLQL